MVVVLGAHADLVRPCLAGRDVVTVQNEGWSEGIASSLREGLRAALAADPSLEALLVAPCDQPALSPGVVTALAKAHRETGRIAASRYQGRNGAPAVFGFAHFELLLGLKGDEGARRILNGDPGRVSPVDHPELAVDLDTPEDYAAWKPE